jgi:hypothetical protein
VQLLDVFRLLTLTYPRYVDSISREAVEHTLHCLVMHGYPGHKASELDDNKVLLNMLDWLATESFHLGRRGAVRYAVVCIDVGCAYLHASTAVLPLLPINL